MTKSIFSIIFLLGILLIPFSVMVYGDEGDLLLTINNPTPENNDLFGWSVTSTSDGNFLIGAWRDNAGDNSAGSVYLYDGTDGTLLLTINNPTPEQFDQFGVSVASTPDGNLLIGAHFDNTGASGAGSAYLFDGTDGTLLLTINNPTPEVNETFGRYVTVTPDGNFLIGNQEDDTGAGNAGSVYLFDGTERGTTDTPLLTLNNPTPEVNDNFGVSVASTPDGNILVGTNQDNTGATNAGSAYLYDGTDGTLLLTINNPTPEVNDNFGTSVASTPDGNLLIGAQYDDTNVGNAGSAYLFDGTDGTLLLTLNNPIPDYYVGFGYFVASTPDGNFLIGTPWDNTGASDTGSVYLIQGLDEIFCDKPESHYNKIEGTADGDFLEGTDADDLIFGYGGDDFISGGLGDDCIFGGDGRDVIHGNYRGGGDEFTNDGNDVINGGHGVNLIYGLTEFDVVVAINSEEVLVLADKDVTFSIFRDSPDMNILFSTSGDELEFNPKSDDGNISTDPGDTDEESPDVPPL